MFIAQPHANIAHRPIYRNIYDAVQWAMTIGGRGGTVTIRELASDAVVATVESVRIDGAWRLVATYI